MRLLYLSNLRLPTEKAYGIQIAKMCEAFGSENIDVELAYPFRQTSIKENLYSYYSVKNNFKIKRLWTPDFYFSGKLDRASVLVKDFLSGIILAFYGLFYGADIIYSRDEWPLYFLSFLSPVRSRARDKVASPKNRGAATSNGMVYEAHRFSPKRRLFYNRFKKKGIKIIAISEGIKKDLVNFGYDPRLILVSPDGVNPEEFNINISKEEARVRVGLPADRKIAMYTGHLFEWKGINVLLESARKLPEVIFVFVGGMDYDIQKFKEKAYGLNNVFILGQKPYKDIPAYLKAADVLVLPNSGKEEISRSYTSPLKMFEYMVSGRPIVASTLPSVSEVLNDQNSILVKPDDADSLIYGIKKVFNDKILAEEIAQKAFEDVQKYTWAKRAENIIRFIS